jgi:DsbC/DsbD-like thiol-disulfide interchange protein
MPENQTDETTDEQGQAEEPTQPDGADETTESDTAGEQPTPDEVDAALKAVEGDGAEESADDEDDDDDVVAESEGTKDLLKKLRKKNRESKGLRERATTAELKLAKYDVAAQTGLPLDLAMRLQGSTAEELTRDAETLLGLVGRKARIPGAPPATGDRQGGFRANPDSETDLGKIGARIYER